MRLTCYWQSGAAANVEVDDSRRIIAVFGVVSMEAAVDPEQLRQVLCTVASAGGSISDIDADTVVGYEEAE